MRDPQRDRLERTELLNKPTSGNAGEGAFAQSQASAFASRTSELCPPHLLHPRIVREHPRRNAKKLLRVMKFGGTSVGNASSIEKVVSIVLSAARESNVVVVVSAMSGVTNRLVEVAAHSEAGNSQQVVAIFRELHLRHETAAASLIRSDEARQRITRKFQQLFEDCERLCHAAIRRRELRSPERDAISGLGERLSAPLVAAALAEVGLASEAVESTELVITDSCHGAAEPFMDLTRERCEARLHPLLLQGIVPVVTGFIGATVDGALTTLGRNSSDFSGTIMGAALDADEVTLWTDVNGVLTADPRLVPEARSILEMSYREASDLADLGAKVLHPKTLHPVMQRGIPLLIRNTFAPENLGTRITATGSSSSSAGVRALTATDNVALITLRRSSEMQVQEFLSRVMLAAANVPAMVRLMPRSLATSDKLDNCIVVDSALATLMVEALHREFAHELTTENIASIEIDPTTAIVTVVGEGMRNLEGLTTRVLDALTRENLKVLASAQSASKSSVSFVVAHRDIQATLIALHRELQHELYLHANTCVE